MASDFDDDEKEVDLMERDRHRNCVREKLTKIRKHEKELMEKKSDSEIDSSDNDELTEVSGTDKKSFFSCLIIYSLQSPFV